MDRHKLAWAAGFFDGEGWANATGSRSRRTRQPHAQINQAGPDGAPEVLLRFQCIVGVGGVGLADAETNLYRWTASSREDVRSVYESIRPWLGAIKRAQFERALGITETAAPDAPLSHGSEELAWAAGLFDGEGSVCLLRHRSHSGYFVAESAVTQSGVEVPEVLLRFQQVVGSGNVYGPYGQKDATLPVYRWKCVRLMSIEAVLARLWPWLGRVKRAQATRVLTVVRAQPLLRRGNPAWGWHKTHCVHGHEYAKARVRPFVPRRGGRERRASKQCLVCLREYAARKRAESRRLGGG